MLKALNPNPEEAYIRNLQYTLVADELKKSKKKPKKKRVRPSSYGTMPHYFPTEQVDIVDKMKKKKKLRRLKPKK